MKNKKNRTKDRADKFVESVNGGKTSQDASTTQVEVKPEVVKNIPNNMGRHGSDKERELNPEE